MLRNAQARKEYPSYIIRAIYSVRNPISSGFKRSPVPSRSVPNLASPMLMTLVSRVDANIGLKP